MLKDSIIQYVKENTAKISLEELDTVLTAEAIAGYFQVKRNTVSYYLNQEIGKTFFKINTRPVRFLDKKVFEKNFFTVSKDVYASVNDLLDENKRKNGIQKEEKQEINFVEEQDVFQNLIGSNGSLKNPIEQMKTSIFYPNTSLPVFLHGPTGSGKTTLMRCITREVIPTRGQISVGGNLLRKINRFDLALFRRDIGVVFQSFLLLPNLTAFENVAFVLHRQRSTSSPL